MGQEFSLTLDLVFGCILKGHQKREFDEAIEG